MQIHDELVFEIPKNKLNIIYKKIKYIMENTVTLNIPIITKFYINNKWNKNY